MIDRSGTFHLSLHGLRGLAAFGVFAAHCANGYALHLGGGGTPPGWLAPLATIGTFGVELFFLLSGYVILRASLRSSPRAFLAKRFWRLYPVFLLFTLAFFALNGTFRIEPDKAGLDVLLWNLSFLNLFAGTPALTPNAWTVTFEVCFYALTFGVVYPIVRGRRRWLAALVALLGIAFAWRWPISLYYVAGVGIALLTLRTGSPGGARLGRLPVRALELAALATMLLLASSERSYGSHGFSAIAERPSTAVLLVATATYVWTLLGPHSLTARLLARPLPLALGTVSYTLYLAHPYSYLVAREFLLGAGGALSDPARLVAFVALTAALTAALVHAVHRFYEAPLYRRGTGTAIVGGERGSVPVAPSAAPAASVASAAGPVSPPVGPAGGAGAPGL